MAKYNLVSNKLEMFKYSTDEFISIEIVKKFIDRHKTERLPLFIENEAFIYQQGTAIDSEFKEQEEAGVFAGERLKNNYANIIVDTHTSYFIGNGLSYTSSTEEEVSLDIYQEIRTMNDLKIEEQEIAENMATYGFAYELVSTDDEGMIVVQKLDPKSSFVIYDYSITPKPIYGVRYYSNFNGDIIVEIYAKTYFQRYNLSENDQLIEEKINLFGVMPMIEYLNNNLMNSDFQPVKTFLIDYDKTMTTESNLIHYINDAILVFENVNADIDKIALMIKNKAVILPSEAGSQPAKMTFLEKPLNVEGIKEHIIKLKEAIFNQSSTPMLTSEAFTKAPSGKALQTLYLNADTIARKKERFMSKGLKRRLDVIFTIVNFSQIGTPYEYKTINPVFTRNLPTLSSADLEDIKLLANLGVKISQRTLLESIPNRFIDDVEKELERIAEEESLYDFPDETDTVDVV